MSAEQIKAELFGEQGDGPVSWSLTRGDNRNLTWRDSRLGFDFGVTQGFLVALHEVSAYAHAKEFAEKNRIALIENRGLIFRGTAEIAVRCAGLAQWVTQPTDPTYILQFIDGAEATLGFASPLFRQLVVRPAAEQNIQMPDPQTITTLVITNVDRTNVSGTAEVCLYHLRDYFPTQGFEYVSLDRPPIYRKDVEEVETPGTAGSLHGTLQPWAIAFFNRAVESEQLTAFLYFYRVLEACFDFVLSDEVGKWRGSPDVSILDLIKKIRSFGFREDKWALRRVLTEIVDQKTLDQAAADGLITQPNIDELVDKIYARRNEIAHGRRGQLSKVLVPFAVPVNETPHFDARWFDLMRKFAKECCTRWILTNP
jgi:hypothetical protein